MKTNLLKLALLLGAAFLSSCQIPPSVAVQAHAGASTSSSPSAMPVIQMETQKQSNFWH